MHITCDQRHKFIRIYDETRYLVLFALEKYNVIHNRIRYLKPKSGITYKIKVDSYDSLSKEKTLALHNVKTHIKSVPNKDQNHCYYILFQKRFFIH